MDKNQNSSAEREQSNYRISCVRQQETLQLNKMKLIRARENLDAELTATDVLVAAFLGVIASVVADLEGTKEAVSLSVSFSWFNDVS